MGVGDEEAVTGELGPFAVRPLRCALSHATTELFLWPALTQNFRWHLMCIYSRFSPLPPVGFTIFKFLSRCPCLWLFIAQFLQTVDEVNERVLSERGEDILQRSAGPRGRLRYSRTDHLGLDWFEV